ncbi:MAG: ribonuclease Z [Bacteroidales bacterium]|nr:ribonuclease Z [Candidatus Colimorpha onthohippi]
MDFYTTILGSGAAVPTPSRSCAAQVVNIRGFRMLLDCGEGTQVNIRQYHQKMQSVSLVCVSHLHGDHFFGLPGLLSSMHLHGRKDPIVIVGPQGIRQALQMMNQVSQSHIDFPVSYLELPDDMPIDAPPVMVFCNSRCRVSAFPICHSVPTFGYMVDQLPRVSRYSWSQSDVSYEQLPYVKRYVYCSDTCLFDMLPQRIQQADLLCIESTFCDDFESVAAQKQHLTARQAARVAHSAGVRKLLLTHFSLRYKDKMDQLLLQAQSEFPDVQLAQDGERYYC